MDSSVNSLETLSYFILNALKEEGKVFLTRTKKTRTVVSNFFGNYKISLDIAGFGGSIEKQNTLAIAIQEEFYKELVKISDNIQKDVPCTVIMLDEAEHLQSIDGAWGFLRSVFTRLLENERNYLVIISGKLGLFSNIKEIFSPMERFFFPKEISFLSPEETIEAIEKPMNENKIEINEKVKKQLIDYTDGHPFIIQVFGYYLFQTGQKQIDDPLFQKELPMIQKRLETQVFKDRFEAASIKERLILKYMAEYSKNSFRPIDIVDSLTIKKDQVRPLLKRLLEKDCLIKVNKTEYALFHKLFKLYIKSVCKPN